MERRKFLGSVSGAVMLSAITPFEMVADNNILTPPPPANGNDRELWVNIIYKMANPIFSNLAKGTLKKNMLVEKSPFYDSRKNVTYLEAVGRCLAGIAPWLALPDDSSEEGRLRASLRSNVLKGIANGVNPSSPDYLNFRKEHQPIVDAAYMVHGFVRARKALWEPLDAQTKTRVITELKALRTRKAFDSNWLLFTALTESFLLSIGEKDWDKKAVDKALDKFDEWYVGDGWYSDGPTFALDYYNSFVIHPMLVDTLEILVRHNIKPQADYDRALKRMLRYADQLERMISPVGTFPVIGRSITYRTGAMQALAQVALEEILPEGVSPAQVRCALTKVTENMLGDEAFDENGWLKLGFTGHTPEIADYYTSTGSLYMASLSFLPLGLPADNPFWNGPAEEWTSQKAWNGAAFAKDYHVKY
ncbi:DUF2264 domain-containing protein [Gelidibacter maritimus]|uniref:DUF2264 domain-containing protein n=1 Tax=Gelidibacter maritimus TaxID=2761487 RepID=A0A7W2M8H8_9FLAO|nr:DUF2264 domain-containing protein [Gelidibacter maritimus]MBA6154639.1 DUF2264 domain-containing protein [Gelidibacter maritimus]